MDLFRIVEPLAPAVGPRGGGATISVPDCIRTELRTVLAITFGDRSDESLQPSQVAVNETILT